MSKKDILDEMGLNKVRAAAEYYKKLQNMKVPRRVGKVANMFGVRPRELQNELDRQGVSISDVPVRLKSLEGAKKKKKKKQVGAVPLATIAGYSGAPAQAGGMGGGSGDGGAGGGAAAGVGESAGSTFDAGDINALATMGLDAAKDRAKELIMNNWSGEDAKRRQLRSLYKARDNASIMALMYNILLKGEGLGTVKARGRKEPTLGEKAPPGQEDFIKSAKDNFKKQYGTDWKAALYSTAWKRHRQNEGLDEAVHSFEYDLARAGSPDEIHSIVQKYLKRLGHNVTLSPKMYRTTGHIMKQRGNKEIGDLLWQAGERLKDFETLGTSVKEDVQAINEADDFFGLWKAVVKTKDGSFEPLENFVLSKEDVLRLKKREIAMKHRVRIEDVYVYNYEPELDEASGPRVQPHDSQIDGSRSWEIEDMDQKEYVADRDFKVRLFTPGYNRGYDGRKKIDAVVKKGDTVWNLPGGFFTTAPEVVKAANEIKSVVDPKWGALIDTLGTESNANALVTNLKPATNEAKAWSDFAAGTGHANRVYGVESDTKKLVADRPFEVFIKKPGSGYFDVGETATVNKGDIIWNIPGGIFIDGDDVIRVVKKLNGHYVKGYGGGIARNQKNTQAVAKNASEVYDESVINKINGAKKKVKRKVNISQRRPHEHKRPSEKLQNKQRRDK